MKWFKHISDSLDDPFIFELMSEFGSDGYVVFFGVLEIYSREFRTENGWKLETIPSYFHKKLLISPKKIKKILSKIYKWEVELSDDKIRIFIPKFKELMDESTLKKIRDNENSFRNNPGTIPKNATTEEEEDIDKDKYTPLTPRKKLGASYTDDFETFWKVFPRKVGKDAAWRRWKSLTGTRPELSALVSAIRKQAQSDQWQKENGQFIPNPATWLNQGRWADEITESDPFADLDRWKNE